MVKNMKQLLMNLIINITMMAAIAADEFMSNEYAGNIAIFAAWFFIVTGFIALTADPKDLFRNIKYQPICKAIQYAMIALMVAVGWTVTGFFYFIVAVLMHIKYAMHKDRLKKAAA